MLNEIMNDPQLSANLNFVLILIFFGAAVACVMMLVMIRVPGKVVRRILEKGGVGEGNAKSAEELGYRKEKIEKRLKGYNGIGKYVMKTEDGERFFIPEEKRIEAELRYDGKKASIKTVVIAIILLCAGCAFLAYTIPLIWQLFKNFFNLR